LQEISQALTTLSRQSSLASSIRLSSLQTHLAQLQHRLIRLAAQSPAFIPSLHSSALRPEEMETKKTLEGVKAELDGKKASVPGQMNRYGAGLSSGTSTPKKGGGARMMGQVNELWGQVEELRRQRGRRAGGGEKEGWLSDERVLGEVAEVSPRYNLYRVSTLTSQVLSTQQMALQKLNDLATNAVFDADVMRQALGLLSPQERNAS
jgi:nuclear pore complex protein Nup54